MTETDPSAEPRHPIRVVADRTGLSPSVLRAWERRYGVVNPGRSEAGQRLYSDADIGRISMLAKAAAAGRSVGQIARLPLGELAALVADDADHAQPRRPPTGEFLDHAYVAVTELQPVRLQTVLRAAVFSLGVPQYLDEVAGPLLRRIGDAWHAGEIEIAHEHAASAAIRATLEWLIESLPVEPSAPAVVLACPARERHELGAMLAAGAAARAGWRVIYLGADTPSADIAAAARQHDARAVGVSVIAPTDSDATRTELASLRAALPARVALLVGGSGISRLGELAAGVTPVRDLAHWSGLLGQADRRQAGRRTDGQADRRTDGLTDSQAK